MDIITKRLLLREFAEADLPGLLAYQADPRYSEFWLDDSPGTPTPQLLTLFRRWAVEVPRRNYQLAMARLVGPDELIGSCGLRSEGSGAGSAEFGIEVAPRWWAQGYATEAARAILTFGFRKLGLQEVRGVSVTENTRVTSIISRLGFVPAARSAGPTWVAARGWSLTEWQLTRTRWEATEVA